jgi:hypothetical protein
LHAVVLHPNYKLQYFIDNGWSEEWRQTVVDFVEEIYEGRYKKYDVLETVTSDEEPGLKQVFIYSLRFNSSYPYSVLSLLMLTHLHGSTVGVPNQAPRACSVYMLRHSLRLTTLRTL